MQSQKNRKLKQTSAFLIAQTLKSQIEYKKYLKITTTEAEDRYEIYKNKLVSIIRRQKNSITINCLRKTEVTLKQYGEL